MAVSCAGAASRGFIAVLAASLCMRTLPAQETAADPWDGLPREKAASLQIEWRGGAGTKSGAGPADIHAATPVTLTVAASKPGDQVRWWQLIPDTRKFYKNASHPWEPEPHHHQRSAPKTRPRVRPEFRAETPAPGAVDGQDPGSTRWDEGGKPLASRIPKHGPRRHFRLVSLTLLTAAAALPRVENPAKLR